MKDLVTPKTGYQIFANLETGANEFGTPKRV